MKKTNFLFIMGATSTLASMAPIAIVTTSCSSSNIVSLSADVGSRTYSVGDKIYQSDIRVYAKYKDGTTKLINDFTVKQELPYEFTQNDLDTPIVFDIIAANRSTFVTIIPTTNEVSKIDKQYIDYVNEYTHDKESLVTCNDAVAFAESLGLDITNYKLSTETQEIMYDLTQHVFIIMSGSKLVYAPQGYKLPSNAYFLFKFVDSYETNCSYSQFFKKDFVSTTKELIISSGIDVGANKNIPRIKYATETTQAVKTVPIRTYCDIFEVDTNDEIVHYGTANDVYISKAKSYTEIGNVAYLEAENVEMQFRTKSAMSHCSIDTFNAKDNVTCPEYGQDYGAFVYTSIGKAVANLTITYQQLTIINAKLPSDLINRTETACIIRLDNDIDLETTQWQISGQAILLDLNGHKLSVSATTYGILISENSSLILMDTQRRSAPGSVELTDCSITINGGATLDKTSNLVLNGAIINYTATSDTANSGAIYIGKADAATVTNSNFYMYGGKITATKPTALDTSAFGVCPRNIGAYFQMLYGEIDTTNGTNCITGNKAYYGTYIDIVGGELYTDANNACIYHPQTGNLHITDGLCAGGTCIAYKAGNIEINGGTFIAYGKSTTPTSGDNNGIDGSVFVLDAINNNSLNPVLSVSSATMYSRYKYIINAVGGYQSEGEEKTFNGVAEVDFFSGNYMYGATTLELQLGYLYDSDIFTEGNNLRMTQNGIWTYVEP